jgi:hypothetical protein
VAIRITRIDDMDGTEGAEAMSLELDHKAYEIDLCPRNRVRLLRVIRPFIDRARSVGPDEVDTPSKQSRSAEGGRYPPGAPSGDGDAAGMRTQLASRDLDIIEMAREVRD